MRVSPAVLPWTMLSVLGKITGQEVLKMIIITKKLDYFYGQALR